MSPFYISELRPVSPKNNSRLRLFFDEIIFSRVLLQRIHQFFCQNIIAAGDHFWRSWPLTYGSLNFVSLHYKQWKILDGNISCSGNTDLSNSLKTVQQLEGCVLRKGSWPQWLSATQAAYPAAITGIWPVAGGGHFPADDLRSWTGRRRFLRSSGDSGVIRRLCESFPTAVVAEPICVSPGNDRRARIGRNSAAGSSTTRALPPSTPTVTRHTLSPCTWANKTNGLESNGSVLAV